MNDGGAERAVYQLVRAQRRTGIEADVLTATTAGFYGERLRSEGVSVGEGRLTSGADYRRASRLSSVAASYSHIHFHVAEPVLANVLSGAPARLFYTHRGGRFRYPWRQALRYRAFGWYVRRRFGRISANSAAGAAAAARMFRLPPGSVAITYNGLDFDLLRPHRSAHFLRSALGVPRDAFVIGTSANLRPWKRVDRLIAAVAHMAGRNVRCVILGDGPSRPELEQLARRLDAQDLILFRGHQTDVADYLQIMDAFVLPSGPEESFGNSAVEAMGVGIPTIIFDDGGGLLEHIEEHKTGLVVEDVAALTAALESLREDPELRSRLGEGGRASVRAKYSIDAMLTAYNQLYAA